MGPVRVQRSTKNLTVGAIPQLGVEEDVRLLVGGLGHVDGHVQILDPLGHLHLGTKGKKSNNIQSVLLSLPPQRRGDRVVRFLQTCGSDLAATTTVRWAE